MSGSGNFVPLIRNLCRSECATKIVMGEGFMWDVFENLFDFLLSSEDTKKILCKCYQNYLRPLLLKLFIIQMSRGVVSVASKRGGVHLFINPEVYLSGTLAKASRLDTSHGIETLYVHSSIHAGIIKQVLRHIPHK